MVCFALAPKSAPVPWIRHSLRAKRGIVSMHRDCVRSGEGCSTDLGAVRFLVWRILCS